MTVRVRVRVVVTVALLALLTGCAAAHLPRATRAVDLCAPALPLAAGRAGPGAQLVRLERLSASELAAAVQTAGPLGPPPQLPLHGKTCLLAYRRPRARVLIVLVATSPTRLLTTIAARRVPARTRHHHHLLRH